MISSWLERKKHWAEGGWLFEGNSTKSCKVDKQDCTH